MVAPAGLPPCGATRRVHHGRETAPFRARRRPALLDATDDTSVSQEVRVSRHWVCHHAGGGERMASAKCLFYPRGRTIHTDLSSV